MSLTTTYNIRITPTNSKDASYDIEITTGDLDWSMSQYQRNRDAFTWEIISKNEN